MKRPRFLPFAVLLSLMATLLAPRVLPPEPP